MPPVPKPASYQAPDRLEEVQIRVEEVKAVMLKNVQAALDRGDKLADLEQKSDHLLAVSDEFGNRAAKLKRHFCLQNAKRTACIVLIVLTVVGVIVAAVFASKN